MFDVSVCFLNFARVIALDRHIEILLLSNDCVIVPGFGGFVAHHIDARKDESDGSFLPPIRSIGFNQKLTINDSLLAQSYVEAYDISYPEATTRIEGEVSELQQRIENEGSYTFNGIGTITVNDEGYYEFAPCEAGILSPTLYGLDSFKMPTLQELRTALLAQTPEQIVTGTTQKEEANETSVAMTADSDHTSNHRLVALWRNLAAASVAVIAFLLFPSPLVNNQQMSESRIDTHLLDRIMPKDITTGQAEALAAVREKSARQETATVQKAKADKQDDTHTADRKSGYAIVLASRVTKANANTYAVQLRQRGYDKVYVYTNGRSNKVLYGCYDNESDARSALNRLNDKIEFEGAWITFVK